eukprot:Skav218922  [mRNA]  locus=scaffold2606:202536:209042:- [translate_table: standard]
MLDATIYPADAGLLDASLQIVATVCHFGPHCIAHVQMPMPQSNTNTNALLRHSRSIEDNLHNRGVDITHRLSLHLAKPADSTAQDKRRAMQSCLSCYSDGERLLWRPPAVIGPMPLVKISEMRGYDAESRPGPTARTEQKGIPVHQRIIDAYLDGLPLTAKDSVVVFDLLPNRAAMERLISSTMMPKVKYFGVFKTGQKEILQQFEKAVYDWWDASSDAPPQQRERTEAERPSLSILAWSGQMPILPDALLQKFPEGTSQHAAIRNLEKELRELWPIPTPLPGSGTSATPARVAAGPDFSDCQPLDLSREVDLPHIAVGKNNKPSILISKEFDIFLGNLTNDALTLQAGELFGFYTGVYESKIVAGGLAARLGERETHVLPFRLESDLTIVAESEQKQAMMLCQYVCKLARNQGLGEEGGGEAIGVPFRYDVSATDAGKTCCFRPNPIAPSFDAEKHKPGTLGVVYAGQFTKLPKQGINKKVALTAAPAAAPAAAAAKASGKAKAKPKAKGKAKSGMKRPASSSAGGEEGVEPNTEKKPKPTEEVSAAASSSKPANTVMKKPSQSDVSKGDKGGEASSSAATPKTKAKGKAKAKGRPAKSESGPGRACEQVQGNAQCDSVCLAGAEVGNVYFYGQDRGIFGVKAALKASLVQNGLGQSGECFSRFAWQSCSNVACQGHVGEEAQPAEPEVAVEATPEGPGSVSLVDSAPGLENDEGEEEEACEDDVVMSEVMGPKNVD